MKYIERSISLELILMLYHEVCPRIVYLYCHMFRGWGDRGGCQGHMQLSIFPWTLPLPLHYFCYYSIIFLLHMNILWHVHTSTQYWAYILCITASSSPSPQVYFQAAQQESWGWEMLQVWSVPLCFHLCSSSWISYACAHRTEALPVWPVWSGEKQ